MLLTFIYFGTFPIVESNRLFTIIIYFGFLNIKHSIFLISTAIVLSPNPGIFDQR